MDTKSVNLAMSVEIALPKTSIVRSILLSQKGSHIPTAGMDGDDEHDSNDEGWPRRWFRMFLLHQQREICRHKTRVTME